MNLLESKNKARHPKMITYLCESSMELLVNGTTQSKNAKVRLKIKNVL